MRWGRRSFWKRLTGVGFGFEGVGKVYFVGGGLDLLGSFLRFMLWMAVAGCERGSGRCDD